MCLIKDDNINNNIESKNKQQNIKNKNNHNNLLIDLKVSEQN